VLLILPHRVFVLVQVVLVQKQIGKERGALFAMKILRKTHLVKRRQIERTRTERKVLSVVNHPFIMKLHYAFQSPDKLYLVLDYCPGGELFFHLSRFRRFPERVARFYAAELLLAIGHLHKRGIIYRDLKPENVLLDADGHVKLGDFGLAKAGIKHPCEGATSMCGTPEYMAPEVLSQHGHGFCVDYWGLGMLIYEMMTGLPPWYTTDRAKLFRRLKSAPLDIPTYFSAQAANCVSALLERNPRRRLGVTGIRTAMEHEFFRSISWRSLYGKRVEAPIRPCEGWAPPSGETTPGGGMNNSAAPHSNSTMENMNSNELDAATANFDNTFTRMPVETEDRTHDDLSDEGEIEELHEDTFVGFTFDDDKDRDEVATASAFQQSASSSSNSLRPRSHPTQNMPASPSGATAGNNAYGSNGSFTRHID
jgi:serum/glucocorticoid-regulated kinase 2